MVAFLVIGAVGFLMLVVTWAVGELFDLGENVLDFFGHDSDAAVEFDGDSGPSPLSSRVIFTFMTAFGGGGAIATQYGLSTVPSTGIGVASGLLLGGMTWVVGRLLWRQQASSTLEIASLVGRRGRVVVTIAPRQTGQVNVTASGQSVTLLARSRATADIPAGSEIEVLAVEGDTLIVDAPASGA